MSCQELYPEGSIAIIDNDQFNVKHNPHGIGIDLHCFNTGKLAMTIAPQYVPKIVDGIRYP